MKNLISLVFGTLLFMLSVNQQGNAQVNGRNVTYVKFVDSSNKFAGTFVKRGGGNTWAEEGTQQGKSRYTFQETHRDDWSVYLKDASRGVNIHLDLHTKKVMYSDKSNTTRRALYKISQVYAGANGWTVCNVQFGHNSSTNLGAYVQKGGKSWVEQNKSGQTTFRFNEVGRDEWSVYLNDPARGVNIQLDLYTKKVMYSDRTTSTKRSQYKINKAT